MLAEKAHCFPCLWLIFNTSQCMELGNLRVKIGSKNDLLNHIGTHYGLTLGTAYLNFLNSE